MLAPMSKQHPNSALLTDLIVELEELYSGRYVALGTLDANATRQISIMGVADRWRPNYSLRTLLLLEQNRHDDLFRKEWETVTLGLDHRSGARVRFTNRGPIVVSEAPLNNFEDEIFLGIAKTIYLRLSNAASIAPSDSASSTKSTQIAAGFTP